jgi:hypothetical protein
MAGTRSINTLPERAVAALPSMLRRSSPMLVAVVALVLLASPALAHTSITAWQSAHSLESVSGSGSALNTSSLDDCPRLSTYRQRLYFSSDRAGGSGNRDIWFAERGRPHRSFGNPVNLGAPINSSANDFCPFPFGDDHWLLFVSDRPGGCGGADLYLTYRWRDGWAEPINLGCDVNSADDETGPMLSFAEPGAPILYFSSTRPGGAGGSDLYLSRVARDWSFGPAAPLSGLNSAYDEARPYVSQDGRELVFDSNRPGGMGSFDLWSASRASHAADWSEPQNIGPNVNSADSETSPSLSARGTLLVFDSRRTGGEGESDLYYAPRDQFAVR